MRASASVRSRTLMRIRQMVVISCTLLMAACGGGGGDDDDDEPPAPPPPTVSVTPPAGASVNRTVTLSATATAASGLTITRVEFLVDGTVIANLTAAPFTTNWDTSTVPDGTHSVTARATDSNNQVATSAAVSVNVLNRPTIEVELTPDETFPKPDSTASGTGNFTFNLLDGSVTGGIDTTGIDATLAHSHRSFAGTTGPIVVNLVKSSTDPNHWDVAPGGMLTAERVDALLRGELYVNVHSADYPAGEIRGQIKPDNIQVAVAYMSGDQVVPPVTSTGAGIAGATVNTATNVATVHLTTTGVDDATEAHVHVGQAGANSSSALLTLTKDAAAPGHWSIEAQTITAADVTAHGNGQWYADVHTPANPNGELRAQLSTGQPPAPPPPPPPAATLTELQNTIFGPICSGCHSGGGSVLPASMNLSSASASFAALVNVDSEQVSSLKRVAPNDPDNSYLVRKVEEGGPNIQGARMPLAQAPLSSEQIANIRSWIASGAPAN